MNTLPHNLDAEKSVLGAILLHDEALSRLSLSPGDFWFEPHRLIFSSMVDLHEREVPIDTLTVTDALGRVNRLNDVGGPAYVSALTDAVPRSVNVEHYAKVVSDYANLREVERAFRRNFKALTETPAELRNGGGARLMESLGAVLSRANIQSETWASASLPELMAQMAEFPSRDPILGDLLALGEIAMFHGQPRDGKTWCSLESTVAVALGDAAFGLERFRAPRSAAVLIVSNEDSVSVYVSRLGMILAARGVKAPPENIRLIVGQGCDLDDPAWQRRVIDEAVRHGTKFLGGHPNPAIDRHLKTGHHS